MKIKDSDIAAKTIAGEDAEGKPLVYIQTTGGLHAIFKRSKDGGVESLAAAPHIGIMKWLAEKKEPKLKWNKDFDKNDGLAKAEEDMFKRMRGIVFAPKIENALPNPNDLCLVYDYKAGTIEVFEKTELTKSINHFSDTVLVRDLSMSDFPKTKDSFLSEGGNK